MLAYALSALGSLLGLTCTARARAAHSAARRTWFLLLAAWAIGGTGIWVMHFIAMLGFGIPGSEIRYDVPLTTLSAIIAIVVVAIGLLTAGFGRRHPVKIILGGTFAGLGVAAMHYTGMAAMRIDGTVVYDNLLVAASIAIAVVAATVALWFTVSVHRPASVVASALVMGVAVSGMHYTGMFAMEVHLHERDGPLTGSSVFGLLLPIVLLVIFVVIALVYAVLAAPTDEDRAGAAYLAGYDADQRASPTGAAGGALPPAGNPVGDRVAGPHPPNGAGPGAPVSPVSPGPAPAPAAPPNGPYRGDGRVDPATRRQTTPPVRSFRRPPS